MHRRSVQPAGLLVSGAYYLAVTSSARLPTIQGGHAAWRYTLLTGLIPAVLLLITRPFLAGISNLVN